MKRRTVVILLSLMLVQTVPARAHIVSIETLLEIVADQDKATGTFSVPVRHLLAWDGAWKNLNNADPDADPKQVVAERFEELLEGVIFNYGETPMRATLKGISERTAIIGISSEEEPKPELLAVYSIEFTPAEPLKQPPAEITFEHKLLAFPEHLVVSDQVVLCLLQLRQSDQPKPRTQVVGTEELIRFKCKWSPTTAPAAQIAAVAPKAPDEPRVVAASASKPSNRRSYLYLAGAAVLGGIGLAVAARRGMLKE